MIRHYIDDLIVTQDGKPMFDQALGLRLFRGTANVDHYRLIKAKGLGWVAFHCGNRIIDTKEMRRGADDPGILIDQIKRIRKW